MNVAKITQTPCSALCAARYHRKAKHNGFHHICYRPYAQRREAIPLEGFVLRIYAVLQKQKRRLFHES
jgi:hypothetical protein